MSLSPSKAFTGSKLANSVQLKVPVSPTEKGERVKLKMSKSPQPMGSTLSKSFKFAQGDPEVQDKLPEKKKSEDLTKYKIRPFPCPQHPKSQISRVLNNPSSQKLLYCTQCVIEADPKLNPLFMPFDKSLHEIHSKLEAIDEIKIDAEPPEMLLGLLEHEDELIKTFTDHIDNQKTKLQSNLKTIKKEIKAVLKITEEKLIKELEMQELLFVKNLADYRKKINRYFTYKEDIRAPTKETLFRDINDCKELPDLEVKMRSYLMELEEAKKLFDDKVGDQVTVVIEGLTIFMKQLEGMTHKLPEAPLNNDKTFETILKSTKKFVEDSVRGVAKIDGEVFNLGTCTLDSRITTYHDLGLLRKWIAMDGGTALKFIGRAEKDASNFDKLAQIALGLNQALIIVRSQRGEIMGCFRSAQRGAITFSITNQTVKKDLGDAIQKLGMYCLTPSFRLTWKQKCRYNSGMFDAIDKHNLILMPERSICLAQIETEDIGHEEGREKAYFERTFHCIEELEIFSLEGGASALF